MKITLNLATQTSLNRRAVRLGLLLTLLLLAGLLVWNLIALGRELSHLSWMQDRKAELEQDLVRVRGLAAAPVSAAAVAQRVKEVELVNSILIRDSFEWTRLLNRLEQLLGEGVTLTAIEPDARSGKHRLAGLARDLTALKRLLDRLNASEGFREVYLLQQEKVVVADGRRGERGAIRFTLELAGEEP